MKCLSVLAFALLSSKVLAESDLGDLDIESIEDSLEDTKRHYYELDRGGLDIESIEDTLEDTKGHQYERDRGGLDIEPIEDSEAEPYNGSSERQLELDVEPQDDADARIEETYFDLPNNEVNETNAFNEELIPKSLSEDRATSDCGCGYSNINPPPSGRIVNGVVVKRDSRPYQAVVSPCFGTRCYLCGGTLINKRYVLTAMHCIIQGTTRPTRITVGLGKHLRSDTGGLTKTVSVQRVIERTDYSSSGNNNDIAILRLSEDIVFNSAIKPACLPTDPSRTYADINAIVSGWGTTSYGGSTSQELRETTVRITPQLDATCKVYGILKMDKMCAYTARTDSCQGDSGGPLVVTEDGRFTVVGVVSYGRGCAFPGYAGVYARVTNFLSWINTNVADGWCKSESPKMCDLRCRGYSYLNGNYNLNGIPSTCTSGVCYATDGRDLCAALRMTSCSSMWCDLRCIQMLLNGVYNINGIRSYCSFNFCIAYNGSDLCSALKYPCRK